MAKATTTPDKDTKISAKAGSDTKVSKAGSKTPAKAPKNAKPNFFQRIVNYIKDVRTEMRRVVWPTSKEVLDSSVVVLLTLAFFVAFTFVIDQVVIQALKLLDMIPVGG